MDMQLWYASLVKPAFAPPADLFGPVWSILYIIIAISFGYVLYRVVRKQIPHKVAIPFILNLVFTLSYTPVTFEMHNLVLGGVIILLVLGTILWMIKEVWSYSRAVAYAQIPYLLWVLFATVLHFSITYLTLTAPAG